MFVAIGMIHQKLRDILIFETIYAFFWGEGKTIKQMIYASFKGGGVFYGFLMPCLKLNYK